MRFSWINILHIIYYKGNHSNQRFLDHTGVTGPTGSNGPSVPTGSNEAMMGFSS